MKFDAIVGNPPYMIMDGGAKASAKPIYNYFIESSKKVEPKYMSFIIPTRWYTGGKGLDDFRKSMLNDKHMELIHDYLTPEYIFLIQILGVVYVIFFGIKIIIMRLI